MARGTRRVAAVVTASLLVTAAQAALGAPLASAARSIAPGCPADVIAEDGFHDVPASNTHESAVDCVVHWGVAQGTARGYLPTASVTRAQMATFVARAIGASGGSLPASPPDAFADDDGSPHEGAIDRLAAAGIVSGSGGRYAPEERVSRAQMATFLVRAYEHRTGDDLSAHGNHFGDDGGSPHESNIDAAATAGFVSGTTSSTYAPTAPVRRDQMGSFLARVLAALVEEGHAVVPAEPVFRAPAPALPDAPAGSYAFLMETGEGPVRYDPCRPLHVVANFAGAPSGAKAALAHAMARIEAATLIDIVYDGETTERLDGRDSERASYQPARYGDRWAPVLVNWARSWQGSGWGYGGSNALSVGGPFVFVSGHVVLNPDAPANETQLKTLLMHELGHVLGLDHVDVTTQVMYADASGGLTEWGVGDLAGLARVGLPAGCLDTPDPQA